MDGILLTFILLGIFLLWFFILYFLQKWFNLSDQTVDVLINVGGAILFAIGFTLGFNGIAKF